MEGKRSRAREKEDHYRVGYVLGKVWEEEILQGKYGRVFASRGLYDDTWCMYCGRVRIFPSYNNTTYLTYQVRLRGVGSDRTPE